MNDQSKTDASSAGTAKGGVDGLVADAKGVASHLASDAKEVVGKLAGDAKSELEKRITTGKDEAAKAVGGVAGALRHTAEDLEGAGPLPRLADQAADRIEQVAEYVQSRTIGDLVREVERFARREPAIFLGSSFLVGILGGRFLKSSSSRRHEPEPTTDYRPRSRGETRAERDHESAQGGGMQVVQIPGRGERAAAASPPTSASVPRPDSAATGSTASSTSSTKAKNGLANGNGSEPRTTSRP